jgi:excisionase family DNA binding protein
MADEILTIREVAELLKINEKTAYKLASAGKIPGFKVGGSWRFQRQEIANWIKRKVEEQQGGNGDRQASTTPNHPPTNQAEGSRSPLPPMRRWGSDTHEA